ncbi:MAG: alanine racemase [Candidatus Bipolaricaulota bacterium]|nr:alanine racemase [Candidatus Bipolaricaulota bacterium]MCX7844049.1 alanine racemase [Candidatus Bipolaricaulota bacterium]MDW8151965.1 alanine racemase [Candidatus Bipolaricaulota bacterium]
MVHAVVDLRAIRANLAHLREWLPKRVALMFVVKEDAYGHGLVPVARAAAEIVDWFGVAHVREAQALRKAGLAQPIFLMIPPVGEELVAAIRAGLHIPLGDLGMLGEVEAAARRAGKKALVHLEIDTGMGRFGLLPEEAEQALASLNPRYTELAGIFSHLSSAYGTAPEDLEFTRAQVWWFRKILQEWEGRVEAPWKHLANSAAVLAFHEATAPPLNLVRVGTAAYGYPEGPARPPVPLTPAARVWTRIAAVREVPAGWPVGYGRTFVTERPARLAILAAGYSHGLRPELRDVLVHEHRAPLVGKIAMDTVACDVSGVARVRRGDAALLFGPEVERPGWVCPVLVPVLLCARRRFVGAEKGGTPGRI